MSIEPVQQLVEMIYDTVNEANAGSKTTLVMMGRHLSQGPFPIDGFRNALKEIASVRNLEYQEPRERKSGHITAQFAIGNQDAVLDLDMCQSNPVSPPILQAPKRGG